MELQVIEGRFSVCRIEDDSQVRFNEEFCFTARTDEELSLVCREESVPGNTLDREDGWCAFRIKGVLDFSLVGILSKISTIMAENKIGIFAVSTYNTDYVFIKEENFQKALKALKECGYSISGTIPCREQGTEIQDISCRMSKKNSKKRSMD